MSSYTNDTKPSAGSYSFDAEAPAPSVGSSISAGQPLAPGFFMFLTYPSSFVTAGYVNDTKPSAGSYTFDSEPS